MGESARDKHDALLKAVFQLRAKAHTRLRAFSCFLDEIPYALTPRRVKGEFRAGIGEGELIVNPNFWYQQDRAPGESRERHVPPLDGFLQGYPIAWTRNPGTPIWVPYWARGDWPRKLRALRARSPAPSTLAPEDVRTLALAEILVDRGYEEAQTARWARTCEIARSELKDRGYAIVRDLLHPQMLGAMRLYYRVLLAEGNLPLGDDQTPERYRLHSEALAAYLHPQLTGMVGWIAGEEVKPSYVYFASYRPGASLPKHTDREQCEFSISLLADYVPDPQDLCGWPLYLENPSDPEEVNAADLGVGDCVFYLGRKLPHYRKELPPGHQSTSLFLHYVRAGFSGRLW